MPSRARVFLDGAIHFVYCHSVRLESLFDEPLGRPGEPEEGG